jgi:hypothetical protein
MVAQAARNVRLRRHNLWASQHHDRHRRTCQNPDTCPLAVGVSPTPAPCYLTKLPAENASATAA